MRGPQQWLELLPEPATGALRILFARLGLVAACRPLTSGELAECLDMGGERGARYAVYLACDSLRQAGERLQLEGAVQTPFDITQRLGYSDVLAAAGLIAGASGGGSPLVRLLDEQEDAQAAIAAGMPQAEASAEAAPGGESLWAVPQGQAAPEGNPFLAGEQAALTGALERAGSDMPAWASAAQGGGEESVPGASGPASSPSWHTEGPAYSADRPAQAVPRHHEAYSESGSAPAASVDTLARQLADRLRDAAGNM